MFIVEFSMFTCKPGRCHVYEIHLLQEREAQRKNAGKGERDID